MINRWFSNIHVFIDSFVTLIEYNKMLSDMARNERVWISAIKLKSPNHRLGRQLKFCFGIEALFILESERSIENYR